MRCLLLAVLSLGCAACDSAGPPDPRPLPDRASIQGIYESTWDIPSGTAELAIGLTDDVSLAASPPYALRPATRSGSPEAVCTLVVTYADRTDSGGCRLLSGSHDGQAVTLQIGHDRGNTVSTFAGVASDRGRRLTGTFRGTVDTWFSGRVNVSGGAVLTR